MKRLRLLLALLVLAASGSADVSAQTTGAAPAARHPDAVVDLRTTAGTALVKGQWRTRPAAIVEVDHHQPGADLKPSGPANRTHDVEPKAGAADFDDSAWDAVAPESLEARRGSGRLSFNWYRIAVTIPEKLGAFDPTGAAVVFEIAVDDYAEVWVNGQQPLVLGQVGGALVAGFNAPNRVVLTRSARPGERFQITVFTANGPLSNPPGNYIWVRSATLDFHRKSRLGFAQEVDTKIERLDPALDAIVGADARIERVAGGFEFIEGPVWVRDGGYLLFSDPNHNVIYRWTPDGEVSVFRTKSGYAGVDIGEYGQPGSNGLTLDKEGRLTIDEHGNRRVTRLEKNGVLTVLADRYQGKRLNSPNDLVYRSDGTLYFTDPPFGLPKFHDDPRRELGFCGVFALIGGKLELVSQDLQGPNGIAFSPDEKFLYVTNWDVGKKVILRYPVKSDGRLGKGAVFFDMAGAPGEEALDGLKIDQQGNLYASGPGGVWILSAAGKHLGTLAGPELAANFAWGDEDGRTLYMAARTSLYRIRLGVAGIRP